MADSENEKMVGKRSKFTEHLDTEEVPRTTTPFPSPFINPAGLMGTNIPTATQIRERNRALRQAEEREEKAKGFLARSIEKVVSMLTSSSGPGTKSSKRTHSSTRAHRSHHTHRSHHSHRSRDSRPNREKHCAGRCGRYRDHDTNHYCRTCSAMRELLPASTARASEKTCIHCRTAPRGNNTAKLCPACLKTHGYAPLPRRPAIDPTTTTTTPAGPSLQRYVAGGGARAPRPRQRAASDFQLAHRTDRGGAPAPEQRPSLAGLNPYPGVANAVLEQLDLRITRHGRRQVCTVCGRHIDYSDSVALCPPCWRRAFGQLREQQQLLQQRREREQQEREREREQQARHRPVAPAPAPAPLRLPFGNSSSDEGTNEQSMLSAMLAELEMAPEPEPRRREVARRKAVWVDGRQLCVRCARPIGSSDFFLVCVSCRALGFGDGGEGGAVPSRFVFES